MDEYIGRTLTYLTDKGELARIEDTQLFGFDRPLIILGEPGMGKTRLLRHLEKAHGWAFRSAAGFVAHPNPAQMVPPGQRLVIDGLDELSAAQESDPVYRVLGQLIRAGCPPFVLSCRSADWRGAVARQDISEEYPAGPLELTLDPFSEEKATAYLAPLLGEIRAAEMIAYLVEKNIPDLFGNPLTLKLFGEVAERRIVPPETRGELIKAATEIMWNERNDRHDGSSLSNMDEASALKAAGAACAAYILTGSEAIAFKPSSTSQPNVLQAAEIQALPDGDAARVILGSRLFGPVPGASDQFKPVHRTVAEYLGARWLAGTASDALARERVLAMMTIDSGVPASLRGLHAWLAQDGAFAPAVIATDPYGVLRYGDPDSLSPDEGRALLLALQALQRSNPYFRAEDWGHHSARGLTHLQLRYEMREALVDERTTYHLRTLLLGAIRGSELAAALADDLCAMVLDEHGAYSHGERHAAAYAMAAFAQGDTDWPTILRTLVEKGDDDSPRLALETLGEIGFETMDSDFVARAILAYLGLLDNLRGDESERSTVGVLYQVARELPDTMVASTLDAIAALVPPGDIDGDYRERSELADTVTRLITRQLDIAPPDPLDLLRWLRVTPGRFGYSREDQLRLEVYLKEADVERRAIQRHAIFQEQAHDTIWGRIWRLTDHSAALALGTDDIIHFLTELSTSPDRSDSAKDLWREFASFARRDDENGAAIIAAARPFVAGDPELETYLEELQKPLPPPEWQVKQEARRNAEAVAKATAQEQHREDFTTDIAAVRAGDLQRSYPIAKAYLGRFRDIDEKLPPADRIGEWLGPELQDAGLLGVEAVLHRGDLPSLEEIARSYAESKRWNFIYPIIAGVVERVLSGRGLDGIDPAVLLSARIGLDHEHLGESISQDRVAQEIDARLRRDPQLHERYIRLLLEPSLEGRREHVTGLYGFVRSTIDRPLAIRLATEWLQRFQNLPVGIEIELVDVLVGAGEFAPLRKLANAYAAEGYDSDERRRSWLANGLLCDFEEARQRIGAVPVEEKDLLWYLRHRFGAGRDDSSSVPSVEPVQLGWIVTQFRGLWPYTARTPGISSGNTNAWDATEVIRDIINRIAADTSPAATETLVQLIAEAEDGYTNPILYAADQQRRSRRELAFPGVPLERLKDVVERRPPRTSDDLLVILRYTLARVQTELRGNDTDSIVKYWRDDGQPRGEDRCTDALTEDIARFLPDFGITRTPQADMPAGKIADLLYVIGDAALPIECKGQWNAKLWTAAADQLDAFYVRDWRVQDRGIYLVYWFGPEVANNFRLKAPPGGLPKPDSPEQLREALAASIAPARRGSIWVEVLDLTR
jgi:hypothetical protein